MEVEELSPPQVLRVSDFFEDDDLNYLAQFAKRMTYNDAYKCSEGVGEDRREYAYRIIHSVECLQKFLKSLGHDPR